MEGNTSPAVWKYSFCSVFFNSDNFARKWKNKKINPNSYFLLRLKIDAYKVQGKKGRKKERERDRERDGSEWLLSYVDCIEYPVDSIKNWLKKSPSFWKMSK